MAVKVAAFGTMAVHDTPQIALDLVTNRSAKTSSRGHRHLSSFLNVNVRDIRYDFS
jgi:hypothetical protein